MAKREQARFLLLQQTELGALVVSAVGSELAWRVGSTNITALAGAGTLLVAIVVRIYVTSAHPEHRWYDARATAESAKTLCWQYAVGGEAFPLGDTGSRARYLARIRTLTDRFPGLDVPAGTSADAQLTPAVEALRSSDLDARRAAYRADRVLDQQRWYSNEANINRRRARLWGRTLLIAEVLASGFGFLRGFGVIEIDWAGILAAVAAAALAWRQTKQYESLAESYSVTSHDVAALVATVDDAGTEQEWATTVHDSEAAFSREHTMWLARRQGPRIA